MNHLFASSRLLSRNFKMNIITSLQQKVQYYSKEPKSADSRLLLGEGDFNYADSIRKQVDATQMVATCLDSEADMKDYPKADMHIRRLRKAGATCLFGVDVHHLLSSDVGTKKKYDVIVFNFPEAIEEAAEKQVTAEDRINLPEAIEEAAEKQVTAEDRINRNKFLLRGIFDNSKPLLKPKGFIQVILQDSQEWGIDDIAKQCGLKVSKHTPFVQKNFKGYTPLKGAGMKPNAALDFGPSTVYQIVRPEDFNPLGSGTDVGKKDDGGELPASKPMKKKKGKSSVCSAATWKTANTTYGLDDNIKEEMFELESSCLHQKVPNGAFGGSQNSEDQSIGC